MLTDRTDAPGKIDGPPGVALSNGVKLAGSSSRSGGARPDNDPSPASEAEPEGERSIEERREAFKQLMLRKGSASAEARERRKEIDGDQDLPRERYQRDAEEEGDDDPPEEDEGEEDDSGDEQDGADGEEQEERESKRSSERESGKTPTSREEHESNRLNKAIRLLNKHAGISPEVTRGMTKKAILETSRGVRELIRERDDLRRKVASGEREEPEYESTTASTTASARGPKTGVDDLLSAFDPTKFDDTTVGAMRAYTQKIDGHIQSQLKPLLNGASALTQAMNEIFFESARERLAVRYSQLDNDKVAHEFERKVSRALASGDYSEYRTLTARIRAAAEDVAGRMFPSGKGAPGVPRHLRQSTIERDSRAASRGGKDPLARRREAWNLLGRGIAPLEARRVAGVDSP